MCTRWDGSLTCALRSWCVRLLLGQARPRFPGTHCVRTHTHTQAFDKSGSGKVQRSDFARGLQDMGLELGQDEMSTLLGRLDPACSGWVDYGSFAAFVQFGDEDVARLLQGVLGRAEALAAQGVDVEGPFRLCDADGDGTVLDYELRSVLKQLGMPVAEAEATALIHRFQDAARPSRVRYRDLLAAAYNPPSPMPGAGGGGGPGAGPHAPTTSEAGQQAVALGSLGVFSAEEVDDWLARRATRQERDNVLGMFTALSAHRAGREAERRAAVYASAPTPAATHAPPLPAYAKGAGDMVRSVQCRASMCGPARFSHALLLSCAAQSSALVDHVKGSPIVAPGMGGGGGGGGTKKAGLLHTPGAPSTEADFFAAAREYRRSGNWTCPVCFYRQQEPRRKTCEMCSSENPYLGEGPLNMARAGVTPAPRSSPTAAAVTSAAPSAWPYTSAAQYSERPASAAPRASPFSPGQGQPQGLIPPPQPSVRSVVGGAAATPLSHAEPSRMSATLPLPPGSGQERRHGHDRHGHRRESRHRRRHGHRHGEDREERLGHRHRHSERRSRSKGRRSSSRPRRSPSRRHAAHGPAAPPSGHVAYATPTAAPRAPTPGYPQPPGGHWPAPAFHDARFAATPAGRGRAGYPPAQTPMSAIGPTGR